jgi:hypothetical protein
MPQHLRTASLSLANTIADGITGAHSRLHSAGQTSSPTTLKNQRHFCVRPHEVVTIWRRCPRRSRFIGGMITRKKTSNAFQSVNKYAVGLCEFTN